MPKDTDWVFISSYGILCVEAEDESDPDKMIAFLKENDEDDRALAINVSTDLAEVFMAIARKQETQASIYQLFSDVLAVLKGTIIDVRVYDYYEDVFQCYMMFQFPDDGDIMQLVKVRCRLGEAMVLANKTLAPIFVKRELLESFSCELPDLTEFEDSTEDDNQTESA